MAKEMLDGRSEGGFIRKNKKMTDEEIADAVMRGDINPLTYEGKL